MSAGADSTAYKRLGKTLDLTGRTAPKLNFKFSGDVEANWDWVVVEARDVTTDPNSDAWTTLPEADTDGAGTADVSLTTQETGDSCPEGLATDADAPHPFLLHYWNADCEPTGTTGTWNAFTGSSGGWTDWDVDLSAYAGKKVDLRISVITDWGTLGLGVWVDDLKLTDGATVLESNDFETDLGGWTVGPPPAGTDVPTNGWERRTEEFKEGGVVATDDTLYTGFGFEGINESARNEFMKRTLTHLGVLTAPGASVSVPGEVSGTVEPTPEPAPVQPGPTAPGPAAPAPVATTKAATTLRASAKLKSAKTLRVSRKRAVAVRINCSGDAGAVCRGTVELLRGKTRLGTKRYVVRAGKTATVKVRVKSAKAVKATVKLK